MSCSADLNIGAAMRAVSQALKLDGEDRQMDAYIHYLKCVQYIVQILLSDAQQPGNSKESLVPPATPTQCVTGAFVPNPSQHATNNAPAGQVVDETARRTRSLTPIEAAQRQNEQLMLAYKNRMAKLSQRPSSSSTNMSLTLQRQMAENMAIARARQLALSKKLEERQKRFQQEAAKRLASMGGMSNDEKERMHLYTKILEYEQDTKWPQTWRVKLKQQPANETVALELIKAILKAADHPLTQVFHKYQKTVYNKVYPLVMKHIEQLAEIRVPCSQELKQDTAVQPESVEEMSNGGDSDSDTNTNHESSLCAQSEEETIEDASSLERMCVETKMDLNVAIDKGDKTVQKLRANNSKVLKDMEAFSLDEMDELFEDSDDTEIQLSTDETASTPHSSLPYSSLTSRESVESSGESSRIDELEIQAIKRHLQNMILDVKESLDRLLGMFVVTYEELGTPAGRDLCYSCLEEDFIKPLWPTILPLFRLANKDKERTVAIVMTKHQNSMPNDLKVPLKFCMPNATEVPYFPVIRELHAVVQMSSPLNKLECIVKLCRLICQCVEDHYRGQEESVPSMGADDLLPIMCYVIIRSATPQILSECNAMEEFIPEGYLMGEEGYCLTSLQTALGFCLKMNERALSP